MRTTAARFGAAPATKRIPAYAGSGTPTEIA
jgi:hypothetical protein